VMRENLLPSLSFVFASHSLEDMVSAAEAGFGSFFLSFFFLRTYVPLSIVMRENSLPSLSLVMASHFVML